MLSHVRQYVPVALPAHSVHVAIVPPWLYLPSGHFWHAPIVPSSLYPPLHPVQVESPAPSLLPQSEQFVPDPVHEVHVAVVPPRL